MSTIQSYGLEPPTAGDLIDSLGLVLPREEVDFVLRNASIELGLEPERARELEPPQLRELADHLTRQRGLVSIIARSFVIRLDTYVELGRTQHA